MSARLSVPPLTIIEPASAATAAAAAPRRETPGRVSAGVRAAARRVLDRDGVDLVLRPWQAGWLLATADGREASVPPGCGVGALWLQARLDEETGRDSPVPADGSGSGNDS